MKTSFKGLTKFCADNGIDYQFARKLTKHDEVSSFDEIKARWAVYGTTSLTAGNSPTDGETATRSANRGYNDDFSEEQLTTFDLESLKAIKLRKDIKHKELESEKVRVLIQKTKAELVPFTALVDLMGSIGTITRIQVSSLIASLPAKLEGKEADSATIIIRDEVERVLQELSKSVGDKLEELKADCTE